MTARRIGVTPGSGDYVGAVDTDADDATGNAITAQVFAVINEKGEIADFSKMHDRMYGAQQEVIELLTQILKVLQET